MTFQRAFFIALLAILSMDFAASGQNAVPKVAVADAARIFNEMQETTDLKQMLESERERFAGTLREKQQQLNDLKAQRDQLKPDAPQYQDRNRELLEASTKLEVWHKLTTADIMRNQKIRMMTLYDKVEQAVAELAAQRGIDLVISSQRLNVENLDDPQLSIDQLRAVLNQRNVLFAGKNVDLTADVIALLDAKYKEKK